ncbi:rutC family protein YjgH [Penicillium taxi]|uniref:rutC family protein YjgH n=1 Tax=Penicillium taxi TaxID=168475 RepID=UPI0025458034|nr:rutC family protein YjgH [Penicillium taxi]KAJ5909215.1 rutC family protein YjgH [Penicillium taxi]
MVEDINCLFDFASIRKICSFQYFNYDGVGVTNDRTHLYSQTLRNLDIIQYFGQRGWDESGSIDDTDLLEQIIKAFQNVEKDTREAGLRRWEDIYSIRSYQISLGQSLILLLIIISRSCQIISVSGQE